MVQGGSWPARVLSGPVFGDELDQGIKGPEPRRPRETSFELMLDGQFFKEDVRRGVGPGEEIEPFLEVVRRHHTGQITIQSILVSQPERGEAQILPQEHPVLYDRVQEERILTTWLLSTRFRFGQGGVPPKFEAA